MRHWVWGLQCSCTDAITHGQNRRILDSNKEIGHIVRISLNKQIHEFPEFVNFTKTIPRSRVGLVLHSPSADDVGVAIADTLARFGWGLAASGWQALGGVAGSLHAGSDRGHGDRIEQVIVTIRFQ